MFVLYIDTFVRFHTHHIHHLSDAKCNVFDASRRFAKRGAAPPEAPRDPGRCPGDLLRPGRGPVGQSTDLSCGKGHRKMHRKRKGMSFIGFMEAIHY